MSLVKHSITCAVVDEQDGNQCFFELTAENPIGFSSIPPASYWTQLLNNLANGCPTILRPEDMDSSRYAHLNGLEHLCGSWCGNDKT